MSKLFELTPFCVCVKVMLKIACLSFRSAGSHAADHTSDSLPGFQGGRGQLCVQGGQNL